MLKKLAVCFLFFIISNPLFASNAAPSYIKNSVPNAQLVGEARMSYMAMDIYDASLYATKGELKKERPLALSLTYLRSLGGDRIADKSIEEIRRQGFNDEVTLAAWHKKMRAIFPDVIKGTNLTGVLNSAGTTIFYKDGQEIGRLVDPAFGHQFFSIWLGSSTSEPLMRKNLLNLKG